MIVLAILSTKLNNKKLYIILYYTFISLSHICLFQDYPKIEDEQECKEFRFLIIEIYYEYHNVRNF